MQKAGAVGPLVFALYFNDNLEYTIYSILLLVFKTGIRINIGPFLTQARTRQKNA